MSIVWYFN